MLARLATLAALAATPLAAETDISDLIASAGLSGAEDSLSATPDPSPSDRFALGAVQFLRAVELAIQHRYDTRIDVPLGGAARLPLIRLDVAPNPDARPFAADRTDAALDAVLAKLADSLDTLSAIEDADAVAVRVDTGALWFDIDADGTRDAGEGVFEVAEQIFYEASAPDFKPPRIRFDTADAAWLTAYGHLVSGAVQMWLALDASDAIERGVATAEGFAAFNAGGDLGWLGSWAPSIDTAAIVARAFEGPIDAGRMATAQDHFVQMTVQGQRFWRRAIAETDNDREWIPNANQQSALPRSVPAHSSLSWPIILSEAEAMLRGEVLVPHPRLPGGGGLNIARLLQQPPAVLDLTALIQGEQALPYYEAGDTVRIDSAVRFYMLMGGDIFALRDQLRRVEMRLPL